MWKWILYLWVLKIDTSDFHRLLINFTDKTDLSRKD